MNYFVSVPINRSYKSFANSLDNFALSFADKVTVILKVALSAPVLLALPSTAAKVNTQFSIHFNESLTLQLMNGISNDLLLLHFLLAIQRNVFHQLKR